MRHTFVVVSIVVGLLLWVVAIVNAEPAMPYVTGSTDDAVAVVAIQAP